MWTDNLYVVVSFSWEISFVRSTFTQEFFRDNSYTQVDMPLITFSECEGGCQLMDATLLLASSKIKDVPTLKTDSSTVDFSKDLSVNSATSSSNKYDECLACQ